MSTEELTRFKSLRHNVTAGVIQSSILVALAFGAGLVINRDSIAIYVAPLLVLLGSVALFCRCEVRIDPRHVTVRNPIRTYVLPLPSVKTVTRFHLWNGRKGLRFSLGDRFVRATGLSDRDEPRLNTALDNARAHM